MKKKIVFGTVFVVLFVLQGQAVFAQSGAMSFRLDISNGGVVMSGGQNITDRVQSIAVMIKNDLNMVTAIIFKDGSTHYYGWGNNDVDEYEHVVYNNVRRVSNTGEPLSSERFTGTSVL